MNFSAINFPWVEKNPVRFTRLIWLFAFLLSSPTVLLGFVVRHSWWAAVLPVEFASGMAVIFLLVSIGVRAWMRRVEQRVPPAASGELFRADGYVLRNIVRSPGVVVVYQDRLLLVPLVGKQIEVSLKDVEKASEKRWFNGNLMFGNARGFMLKMPGFWRLGVAVQEGEAFRSALQKSGIDVE